MTWYVLDDATLRLNLKVRPKAGRERIGPVQDNWLKVELKAPAEDGKANAALIKLLARRLKVGRDDITIVTGKTGRRKSLRIDASIPRDRVEALAQGGT
ncbi:MAG: YggU family protein [Deltaproteobacteria bacterium]|nr:YggU family protein [Deltaproteobacteria bacterium]